MKKLMIIGSPRSNSIENFNLYNFDVKSSI